MALKEVTKQIDGHQVFCRQMPATKAMIKKAELIKMGGANILPFIEGNADLVAMLRLEQNSEPENLVKLVKELVCTVRIDGEEVQPALFDMKYAGELWFVVQVFAFACEVNYKDFFEQGSASSSGQ